jgi:small-conductance mechanosensitive channel
MVKLLVMLLLFSPHIPLSAEPQDSSINESLHELIKVLEDEGTRTTLISKLKAIDAEKSEPASKPTTIVEPFVGQIINNIFQKLQELRIDAEMIIEILSDPKRITKARDALYGYLSVLGLGLALFFSTQKLGRVIWLRPNPARGRLTQSLTEVGILIFSLFLFLCSTALAIGTIDISLKLASRLFSLTLNLTIILALLNGIKIVLSPSLREHGIVPLGEPVASAIKSALTRIAVLQAFSLVAINFILSIGKLQSVALLIERFLLLATGFLILLLLHRLRTPITVFLTNRRLRQTKDLPLIWIRQRLSKAWFPLALSYVFLLFILATFVEERSFDTLIKTLAQFTLILLLGFFLFMRVPFMAGALVRGIGKIFKTPDGRLRFYRVGFSMVLYVLLSICMIYGGAFLFQVPLDFLSTLCDTEHLMPKVLSVLLTAIIGLIILESLEGGIGKIFKRLLKTSGQKNLPSLQTLVLNIIRVIMGGVTLLMIFSELGFNITPILASAGVLGLAVSLGSQTLFNDAMKGFFILTEDTFSIGDRLSLYINSKEYVGIVEDIRLRHVKLRDDQGSLHTIPFSTIGPIINESRPPKSV